MQNKIILFAIGGHCQVIYTVIVDSAIVDRSWFFSIKWVAEIRTPGHTDWFIQVMAIRGVITELLFFPQLLTGQITLSLILMRADCFAWRESLKG